MAFVMARPAPRALVLIDDRSPLAVVTHPGHQIPYACAACCCEVPEIMKVQTFCADRPDRVRPGRHLVEVAVSLRPPLAPQKTSAPASGPTNTDRCSGTGPQASAGLNSESGDVHCAVASISLPPGRGAGAPVPGAQRPGAVDQARISACRQPRGGVRRAIAKHSPTAAAPTRTCPTPGPGEVVSEPAPCQPLPIQRCFQRQGATTPWSATDRSWALPGPGRKVRRYA
jgi:hypothetical protein